MIKSMQIRHIMINKKDNDIENRQEIVRTVDFLIHNESPTEFNRYDKKTID